MAIAYVRENGTFTGNSTGVSSRTLSLVTGASAGDTVFLCFACDSTGSVKANWSVTDTKGNTWFVDNFIQGTAGTIIIARTNQDVGTLTNADTITITGPAAHSFATWAGHIEEFSGQLKAATNVSPLDQTATNSGNSTSGPTGTTASTRDNSEMALAYCSIDINGTVTKDAAYTAFTTGTKQSHNATLPDDVDANGCFKILTAKGTQSATFTFATANFIACITTYYAQQQIVGQPTGIASLEAWGVAKLVRLMNAAGQAIASAEAWGIAKLVRLLGGSAVPSAETFGSDKVLFVSAPSGVVSAAQVGVPQLVRLLGETGIVSTEHLGTPGLIRYLGPIGWAEAEAFGMPLVIGGTGPPPPQHIPEQVLVSDGAKFWVAVSDGQAVAVLVADGATLYALTGEDVLRSVNVSDMLVKGVQISDGDF